MRYLLDTHLLIWFGYYPEKLSPVAYELLGDPDSGLYFSVASIWESAIKFNVGRRDFQHAPQILRTECKRNNMEELDVKGEHAEAIAQLPPLHKDPFDRILVAQATIEGITLLTSDRKLTAYPGPIQLV